MGIYKRATQFTPFAALRGYYEEIQLREKRLERVEKIELMEDAAELLNRDLAALVRGQPVEIIYFSDGTYLSIRGLFAGIDPLRRKLKVVKTEIDLDAVIQIRSD
ncbi:MAG: YolD-like family protein [Ruminococcaceae bacterium]|nr:YolD-like family protein [Oscillospiraceae bacterium]